MMLPNILEKPKEFQLHTQKVMHFIITKLWNSHELTNLWFPKDWEGTSTTGVGPHGSRPPERGASSHAQHRRAVRCSNTKQGTGTGALPLATQGD